MTLIDSGKVFVAYIGVRTFYGFRWVPYEGRLFFTSSKVDDFGRQVVSEVPI